MEDRPSGRTMASVKPGVSPGLNGEGFMGQVKDFGLHLNSKWETNRVFTQGGNKDRAGHKSDVRTIGEVYSGYNMEAEWETGRDQLQAVMQVQVTE